MYSVDGYTTASKAFDAMGALATVAFACMLPLTLSSCMHLNRHLLCCSAHMLAYLGGLAAIGGRQCSTDWPRVTRHVRWTNA